MTKKNPKRIPATLYDVERARREGRHEGFNFLLAILLFVLYSDFGFKDSSLQRVQERVTFYCEEITAGRLKLHEIMEALHDEHGVTIELTERRTP